MNKLDKDYQALLQGILDNGVTKSDRTGTGTISVFGRQIRHKMSDGFPLLTTKKMPFKTIVTELLWFLRGDTNIKYLVDNDCHIWDGDAYKRYLNTYKGNFELDKEEFINAIKTSPEFAEQWGELGPIYGKQWRDWQGFEQGWNEMANTEYYNALDTKGIDQITNLINDLKTNPDSRRLMVNAWNVGELDQMVLPPCHYGFQVYTRELSLDKRYELAGIFGKEKLPGEPSYTEEQQHSLLDELVPKRTISLMWNQRSVDTFLGLPFNIASYGLLLEIIAKAVNMVPDELIGNLGDVHLYSNHVEQAKEQIGRDGFELPTLNINTEFWPYEGGECGIGPLDAIRVFEAFKDDNFCKCLLEEDIQLANYQSHPAIKAPLSN
jgi:thymidylate synthase